MDFVTQAPTQQSVPAVPRPDVAAQRPDGAWGHERVQTSGHPLDPGTRAFMEPRFGHDFSRVRVHADASAAEAAQAMHARAYTVGQDIVFGAGQYAPSTRKGRELLAHELVHTIQQTSSLGVSTAQLDNQPSSSEEIEAGQVAHSVLRQATPVPDPIAIRTGLTPMRTWDQPGPQDCTGIAPDVFLTKVVVEQEGSQNVTLQWSDGHLDSGPCSTGKGQCCVDSTTPGGVTCSVARSRQFGSNCTPITQGEPYPITDRYLSYNGWEFWSTFVRSRGIGLHQHHTITGNPISHGCVRLQRETARLIFCGARQNQTVVEVRGFSRPDCSDPQLRSQWQEDFANAAANPSDGETPEDRRGIPGKRTRGRQGLTEAHGRPVGGAWGGASARPRDSRPGGGGGQGLVAGCWS